MILLDDAKRIHALLVERFGGAAGVGDEGLLESALMRPYQTFDGQELYVTMMEKAAALLESIVVNHPFQDGNKRFGYVAMRLTLLGAGLDVTGTEDEKYALVIGVAKGEIGFEGVVGWIRGRVE